MVKRALRCSVFLALVMSVLAPSRFAVTHLCNSGFSLQNNAPQAVLSPLESTMRARPTAFESKKITALDFSIFAGLEVGSDTFHIPPRAALTVAFGFFPEELPPDAHAGDVSMRPDILILHSRRNI